jgi:nitrate reductase molybdenum cofactor assembly chaperone NarJ/NarW
MTTADRLKLKVIALLLQYPDDKLTGALDEIEAVLPELAPAVGADACSAFLARLRHTPLVRLQEEYTRTFDLSPSTCLNLTYHQWGDDKRRGPALAELQRIYHGAGYQALAGELPDFLPLVLEFIAVGPEEAGALIVDACRDPLAALASRLAEAGSAYAGLFEAVRETLAMEPWPESADSG